MLLFSPVILFNPFFFLYVPFDLNRLKKHSGSSVSQFVLFFVDARSGLGLMVINLTNIRLRAS